MKTRSGASYHVDFVNNLNKLQSRISKKRNKTTKEKEEKKDQNIFSKLPLDIQNKIFTEHLCCKERCSLTIALSKDSNFVKNFCPNEELNKQLGILVKYLTSEKRELSKEIVEFIAKNFDPKDAQIVELKELYIELDQKITEFKNLQGKNYLEEKIYLDILSLDDLNNIQPEAELKRIIRDLLIFNRFLKPHSFDILLKRYSELMQYNLDKFTPQEYINDSFDSKKNLIHNLLYSCIWYENFILLDHIQAKYPQLLDFRFIEGSTDEKYILSPRVIYKTNQYFDIPINKLQDVANDCLARTDFDSYNKMVILMELKKNSQQ